VSLYRVIISKEAIYWRKSLGVLFSIQNEQEIRISFILIEILLLKGLKTRTLA
jgi:hypothetical protein